jgi:hypothetical protein
MEDMQDQTYGQIFKMRALERWENEGGRTETHETGRDAASSPDTRERVLDAKLSKGQEGSYDLKPAVISIHR